MSFTPSKYQQAIYDWIHNGEGNGIIEAVAGSGKSSTLIEAANQISSDKRVLFLAFNKAIATELKDRVPAHCEAMTLNGLGHRAWMRFMNGSIKLDANKTMTIIQEAFTEEEAKRFGFGVKRLVSMAKAHGIVPKAIKDAQGAMEDTDESWLDLISHFDIDFLTEFLPKNEADEIIKTAISLARRVLTLSCEHKNLIDFDDQLYLTAIYGVAMPRYDWVFVDESQDLNPIQMRLVEMVSKHGRTVAVGDENQSIYGFRGADINSMSNFKKRFNATSLPLSICYRCPKSHIEMAQTIVPHIEASPTAASGTVDRLGKDWTPQMFLNDDLVICRATAPLVKMAYKILAAKVPVRILGRDIGTGLTSLIKKMKPRSTEHLIEKLDAWAERERDKILSKDRDGNTDKVDDKYETVMTFIDMFPGASPDRLCREIESIYSDNTKGILTLCTCHKSKGLESNRVFILNGWMMPSKGAKKEWQKKQELNLQYVAFTRAKKSLVFIDEETKRFKNGNK